MAEPFGGVCLDELYDGTGRHVAGLFPPLMVNNVLTDVYHNTVASRPAFRGVGLIEPDASNLGLVWMMPHGLTTAGPFSREVIGALVQALDGGLGVVVHADNDAAAEAVTELVVLMAGGGHV